jgi:phosphoribosylformylglycinamidine synthase
MLASGGPAMKARVTITLKTGVLDPQGAAVAQALGGLGFDGVRGVRQGKLIEIELAETDPQVARKAVTAMCEALLANTVIETYAIELAETAA